MKKLAILTTIVISISLTGCSIKAENDKPNDNKELNREAIQTTPTENEVDYSDSFDGINGCALFFSPDYNTYNIYNKDLLNEQISPYSTFKIINSLMGLSQNVVSSADSKLGYDGKVHWREEWNKDITFEEAFKESCVWYYEKIMDSLDKEYVQNKLTDLKYGNSDISDWNEYGHNTFWISSSLKISPLEQIKVLETIFEGKSSFEPKHVDLVKDFMLVESNKNYSVYGKTGSAKHTNSWFTGFIEKDDKRTYFAVRIDDKSQELAGSVAKSIALDIIKKHYNS
ncbi:class D beta-lactamase [Romboutsia weinsteinii]|uniref:beta-lactamase n=1 Tax=Romboutsia weinsteinii TaxID=2020949 RepID=A0A371J0E0_9FIRM|nr:penicillin-binding transpeptidase domain-containing protein [Romboutsia weinsteinii]RDY26272.1 class D beta-lactamase [Romboutsia weinsteinii]